MVINSLKKFDKNILSSLVSYFFLPFPADPFFLLSFGSIFCVAAKIASCPARSSSLFLSASRNNCRKASLGS